MQSLLKLTFAPICEEFITSTKLTK